MPTLLNDWCVFCEGKTYFDKSHFLALFKVHSFLPEITKALSYFPQADSLVSRVNEVIRAGTLDDKVILLLAVKILFHYLRFRDMLIVFLRGMSLLQLREHISPRREVIQKLLREMFLSRFLIA
ncbi:hypothetical protein VRB78_00750 [Pseudomonas trivialis]|uniref:hypothetical protein n=1 Tax=Pseudomonas trivialis TaxID=200450 RepID=UPI0030D27768